MDKQIVKFDMYEMRRELNIHPYGEFCANLEELINQQGSIFLLLNGDEIIAAVSCFENEIGKVAVNLKYQRHGYG